MATTKPLDDKALADLLLLTTGLLASAGLMISDPAQIPARRDDWLQVKGTVFRDLMAAYDARYELARAALKGKA